LKFSAFVFIFFLVLLWKHANADETKKLRPGNPFSSRAKVESYSATIERPQTSSPTEIVSLAEHPVVVGSSLLFPPGATGRPLCAGGVVAA
jgi:hypothetical protein